MKLRNSKFEVERIFLRSCLESAASGPMARTFGGPGLGKRQAAAGWQNLRQRLLRTALEATPHPQAQRQICGAANTAAELAWDTGFPTLLFPCLFQELARTVNYRFALAEWEEREPQAAAPEESAGRESFPDSGAELICGAAQLIGST